MTVFKRHYDLILIKHCVKIDRLEWGVPMPDKALDSIRFPDGIKQ